MTLNSVDAIDEFMKTTLKNLTQSVRSSFDLPTKGTSEEGIFNEFPQYKKVVNGLSIKILNNIQSLIDKQDGKCNILDTGEKKALEDKFNILVEVNDRLLDRCNALIANIENPELSTPNPIVTVECKLEQTLGTTKRTPKETIKLLSSIQIERPQLKFSKQPDNSKAPFRPILTTKPNALRPMEFSDDPDSEDYPHPYDYELKNLLISEEHMRIPENPVLPGGLETVTYTYVDTIDDLSTLVDSLKQETEIAVDLEHHATRSYLGLTCLLQISTRTRDIVVDTLALRGHLEKLNEVFTDPRILKVLHGANSDVLWLQRDLGVYLVGMFDSGQACTLLNLPRKSLSHLLERYCAVAADKEYQRLTDWRIRPLVPELIDYARTDTHYLLYIYDRLKAELASAGLLQEAFAASGRLCALLYRKPVVNDDDCLDLYRKCNEKFDERQMNALRRLWRLRDAIAREEDESPGFVVPNRTLLAMAQTLPRETAGVLACCTQQWRMPVLRRYVHDFHKICVEAACGEAGAKTEAGRGPRPASVLARLLSRHDDSGPGDGDHCEDQSGSLTLDGVHTTEEIFKTVAHTMDCAEHTKIVRAFLEVHPVPERTDESQEAPPVTEVLQEVEDNQAGVEGPGESVAMDLTGVTDLPTLPGADQEVEEEARPAKARKVAAPVQAFDYEGASRQLQAESRAGKPARQTAAFDPFQTRRFKRGGPRGRK